MLSKTSTFALVAAIGLTSAAPTPAGGSSAPMSCAALWPGVLEDIWEGKPQHIAYNTLSQEASDPSQGHFGMGATWNGTAWTSREYTYASFDIPADAKNCALWSSFPASKNDYEAIQGPLNPQVQTFSPSTTLDSSDLTFWDVFPVGSAPNVEEFASTTLIAGQKTYIGPFDCSSASKAEFIVGIANMTGPNENEASVYQFRVNNTAPRHYGLVVTYGTQICLPNF
ncbi:predicted protein [Sclerotinia sclerotiorum 1980 UF-70]|uniref:Ubiquitin 3 binding protein But2 C-terminal domain-containing protein n=2 Tax=Sclerotinia sclerotiorum (strain ATCC 18683 / 1980 / Ss-1) TaxID=665079 RepID=A7EWY2_SCLS1|nr:predicted protein [Sclerotinia sclerotiorum 1980 UF-70]APA05416.1 hypothetical protein sscle_01g001860 [Sclerotinia sclerotiorum 1980 UF-70]EDN93974.1 predicted protein [Sclerotinia sclerotiorum 1980 UF-70]